MPMESPSLPLSSQHGVHLVSVSYIYNSQSLDAMVSTDQNNYIAPPAPRRGRTEENDPPPRANYFPRRPYADDYDYGDWEWDWEWDYPGRHSYPSAYERGGGYEDYPDPHSHRNHRRSSFATDYDCNNRYDDYFEPPPFRNSRRNQYSYNHDPYFTYQAGFEPSFRHQGRRSNTFPSNHGAEYRQHTSHGAPRRDPYARNNNHGTHHRDARESHQHRRSSHTHNYDRPVYAEAYQQYNGHSSSRTHGRNRHTDAVTPPQDAARAMADRPKKTMGKRLSRKFWKIISAFVMCAVG